MLTKFILHYLTKKTAHKTKIQRRVIAGATAGFFGVLTNFVLFVLKLTAGIFSGSVAIIADATNSFSDFAASILTIVGFRISGRKPDQDHPYGHQRFEDIAGFIMALVMLIIGVQFVVSGVGKVINPTPISLNTLTFILMIVSILIKVWQMLIYRAIGKKVDSQTLVTASQDSRNDALTTAGILLAAIGSLYFKINLDGVITLVVAVFIVFSSGVLIKEFISELMGERPAEDLIEEIANQLEQYDNILGFHDLMIHEYGHDMIFAVVHVELDSALTLDRAHEIVDKIERDFSRDFAINLVAHIDPLDIRSRKYSRYYMIIKETIDSYHAGFTIHDFHLEDLPNGDDLIQFDLRLPKSTKFSDDEWLVQINHDLRKKLGPVTVQINFDHTGLDADHSLI